MQQQTSEISGKQTDMGQDDVIHRIGNLTRTLRKSIQELGLDASMVKAAEAVPDVRDRLNYIAKMTEEAANRVLSAGETAQPLQNDLQSRALKLIEMRKLKDSQSLATVENEIDQFLDDVNTKSRMTNELLIDIMLAQGFQDLTGQVINKLAGLIGVIEKELLQVLLDHLPESSREEINQMLNGPQIKTDRPDVVSSQDQVDDLLASLGF